MAIAFVQAKVGTSTADPQNLAFTANVTAGSLLVLLCRESAAATSLTVTDTQSNTWVLADYEQRGTAFTTFIYYAMNAVAGATTVTIDGSGVALRCILVEYSGIATASALDQLASANGSSATPDSGALVTTQADELLVAAIGTGIDNTFTVGTNFTSRGTSGLRCYGEDRIVSSIGTYNNGCTTGVSNTWAALMASFKADVPSVVTGDSTVALPFGSTGAGAVLITGTSSAAWPFSSAGTGAVAIVGTSSVAWPFASTGTVAVLIQGASSIAWPFSSAGTGAVLVTGRSSVTLPFSSTGTGTYISTWTSGGAIVVTWSDGAAISDTWTDAGAIDSTWSAPSTLSRQWQFARLSAVYNSSDSSLVGLIFSVDNDSPIYVNDISPWAVRDSNTTR